MTEKEVLYTRFDSSGHKENTVKISEAIRRIKKDLKDGKEVFITFEDGTAIASSQFLDVSKPEKEAVKSFKVKARKMLEKAKEVMVIQPIVGG